MSTYNLKGKAHRGMTRGEAIEKSQEDLKKAKELRKQGKTAEAEKLEQRAYNRRDKMEKKARETNEALIRQIIRETLLEEEKQTLSKKTEKTIEKKAEEAGYTAGSAKTEYRKGLGAFYSSGSRPGMTAHQWAMARVNKCLKSNPSWCQVKKSKAKK